MRQQAQLQDLIEAIGIVPTIQFDSLGDVLPLADSIVRGGIPLIEVMLRNEVSVKALEVICAKRPDIVAGAGTVTNTEQVGIAKRAGAKFIVAPGFNSKVVAACQKHNLPIIPGCVTPSEVEAGLDMGLRVFKFFPAWQHGGRDAIRMLAGPYPTARFIPTGGLGPQDIEAFLSLKSVLAIGGDFMVWDNAVARKDWKQISETCRKAVLGAVRFQLKAVASDDLEQGSDIQRLLSTLAESLPKEQVAVFARKSDKTRLFFSTLRLSRAIRLLETQGFRPLPDEPRHTAPDYADAIEMMGPDGKLLVCLTERIS